MMAKGKLAKEDVSIVPDLYVRNQEFGEELKMPCSRVTKMEEITAKAKGTWDTFRKERDFNRMHHKRVVQEKNKLVVDIKRLKKFYAAYEPSKVEMRSKYEVAMKEKMMMRLERDRNVAKCKAMKKQLDSLSLQESTTEDVVFETSDAKVSTHSSSNKSSSLKKEGKYKCFEAKKEEKGTKRIFV